MLTHTIRLLTNKKRNMNKYYQILQKVLVSGKTQTNKKGTIRYLHEVRSRQASTGGTTTEQLLAGNEDIKFDLNV